MTDKKKRSKFLEMLWGCYYDRFTPSDKDKAMNREIKEILEQYESTWKKDTIEVIELLNRKPLPGDDLVDLLLAIGVIFQQTVHDKCEAMSFSWTVEEDKAKAKIRKLLSRQPEKLRVKEEDIKEWHEKRDDEPQAGDWIVENDLIDLVKSLGIEVVKK